MAIALFIGMTNEVVQSLCSLLKISKQYAASVLIMNL